MKHSCLFIFMVLLILSGCSPASSIDENLTQSVLDHHWETFINNYLEGVMEDYTEESILITPNGTYMGLEEIRQNFVNAFKAFPAGQATLTLKESLAVKDIGYIL
ncbi:MAG: nuclear transport factor 2 family protein [Cyclobacterium sp.]|uniref:nuclear transport factor 2 family protein n=1 Tax=unclassified Cyclobacterium TaxID=2615055 RepID=UPI0013D5E547|nr:nuclear transport factor 2 family protein [Cyclobacterium sp. SYSU L10401]